VLRHVIEEFGFLPAMLGRVIKMANAKTDIFIEPGIGSG
jgi:hypothetical protein